MKKNLFILIVLVCGNAYCQSVFTKTFSSSKDEVAGPLLESDLFYFFSVYTTNFDTTQSTIYKISKEGDVLSSRVVKPFSKTFSISGIEKNSNESILAISTYRTTSSDTIFYNFSCLDYDLNLLYDLSYSFPFWGLSIQKTRKVDDSTIVILSKCSDGYGSLFDIFISKINLYGDTLKTKRLYYDSQDFVFDVSKKAVSNNLIIVGDILPNSITNSLTSIVEMDSLFNIVDIDSLPCNTRFYNNVINVCDSFYYFTGKYHYPISLPRNDDIKLLKCDLNFNVIKAISVGAADTIDYPGIISNIDTLGNGTIYIGGTKNVDPNGTFSSNPSCFSLFCISNLLEIKWRRFYGGDAYYMLWNLLATSDGGCLMAGTRYDWLTQYNERDAILVKVDSTGLITSTGPGPEMQAHDAIVYPNPGSNVINIESGPQIYGAWFSLYDLAGKLLERKQLNNQKETLQTSALPNGVYLWNIVFKGKTLEGGKWVKTD